MTALLIIVLCLLFNALFAALEMAFVTIRKADLRRKAAAGDKQAIRLLALRDTPERALSVIQVSITLVGAISAAVGGAGAEEKLSPFIEATFGLKPALADVIAIIIIVLPLTYFSVVMGELVPKTIALRRPAWVLAFGGRFLLLGNRILGPIVSILEGSTQWVLKCLPKAFRAKTSEDDLGNDIHLEGMEQHQKQYLLNLAHIERKHIRDIYLPREKLVCVDSGDDFADVLKKVIACGHTRLPVLAGETVRGILHSKEFLSFIDQGNTDWQSIVRPALHVKLEDDVLQVLRQLQHAHKHMALVMGKEDRLLGVVTIEDVLEEIVGEIDDEDDDGAVKRLVLQRSRVRASIFGKRTR